MGFKQNIIKNLTFKKINRAGRNFQGNITVRGRGSGHKRLYRKVNFDYSLNFYQVLSREHDPNRNARVSVVRCLLTGAVDYMLSTENTFPGAVLHKKNTVLNGGRYVLRNLPPNYIISNVGFKLKKGGQMARSAGSFCKVLQKDYLNLVARIKMPSKEERYIPLDSIVSVGAVHSNSHRAKVLEKAGNSRWRGRRPKVRGVAMNPIDHPHGGGEGKTSGGRPSVTPWGLITIGRVTRSKRKFTSGSIVKSRRQF